MRALQDQVGEVQPGSAYAVCPRCRSSRLWRDDSWKVGSGSFQRYLCRDCGLRFTPMTDPSGSTGVEPQLPCAALIDIIGLKRFASLKIPKSSMLRSLILAERDAIGVEEYAEKINVWLKLLDQEYGSAHRR